MSTNKTVTSINAETESRARAMPSEPACYRCPFCDDIVRAFKESDGAWVAGFCPKPACFKRQLAAFKALDAEVVDHAWESLKEASETIESILTTAHVDFDSDEQQARFNDARWQALDAIKKTRTVGAKDGLVAARGIYIASKSKHGARWRALRAEGHPIISTWIDESGEDQTSDWQDLWDRCLREASAAAAFVMYVEPDEIHKGSLVELGAALHAGVPVFWVGPFVGSAWQARGVLVCQTLNVALRLATEVAQRRTRPSLTEEAAQRWAHDLTETLTVGPGSRALIGDALMAASRGEIPEGLRDQGAVR